MKSMAPARIGVIALYFLTSRLSGAATADTWNDNGGSSSDISRITPFSLIQQDFAGVAKDYFSNAYTRLLVVSPVETVGAKHGATSDADDQALQYQKRWWLTRLLMGRHSSTNLSIKVTVGSFTATVPIATIDHISNAGDGENFTRIVYHRAEDFPLFLVKRDGTSDIVSIRSSVRVSDQLQSGAAGTALSVTQSAIRLVAPQAAVLTTLSKQSSKDKATAVDEAINKLFSTNLDEEQWADNHILFWGKGASITFSIPYPEGNLVKPVRIGKWTVAFESPRPSIFSDIFICESAEQADSKQRCETTFNEAASQAESEVNAADVLAFKLVEGTTELGALDAYVKKQDWYIAGVKAFANTPKDSDVASFCSSARNAIAGIDLNSVDQGIIAHALATTLATTSDAKKVVSGLSTCQCEFAKCKS
jgi:hypothetical protein